MALKLSNVRANETTTTNLSAGNKPLDLNGFPIEFHVNAVLRYSTVIVVDCHDLLMGLALV